MRRGRVFRRCGRCRKEVKARACPCGGRATWAYVVDLAAPGEPRKQALRSGFETKAAAVEAMNEAQQQKAAGTYVRPQRVTVGQYLWRWLAELTDIRDTSYDSWERAVRLHLVPRIGAVPLQALQPAQVRRVYKELELAGQSPRSVFLVHACLHRALRDAVAEGLRGTNPADKGYSKPKEPPQIEFWESAEAAAFLAAAHDPHDLALYTLALQTGMRRGELLGLRWRDLDLAAQRVMVRQQLTRSRRGGGSAYTGPKSRQGRRTIDLSAETVAALAAHRTAQPEGRELVFCRADGTAHVPSTVSGRFARAARRAGRRRIRFHDMRHSSAVIGMKELGEWPDECSARLGHASVAFTLETYGHLIPRRGRAVAEGFGRVLHVDPQRWGRQAETGGGDG